jgi:hypothetical protein
LRAGRAARQRPPRAPPEEGTDPIFPRTSLPAGKWGRSLFFALLAALAAAPSQAEEIRTLELENGERLSFRLLKHPADAHLLDPVARIEPSSAINAAKLLNRYLSAGDIEGASLLSNSPRRRYEVFRDYRNTIGEDVFKRVFAQYFYPENRLLAEVVIGRHHLLIWELRDAGRVAGLYFVELEGRYLLDDIPSEARSGLRRVLEAWRSGAIRP